MFVHEFRRLILYFRRHQLVHPTTRVALTTFLIGLAGTTSVVFGSDEFDPPASYYSAATGTGATLKSQLTAAMSAGHIERSYGDFRSSAAIHDRDPNNASRILLVYNLASVSSTWDSGSTWNREHVWPQSRQPGSASNSTRGNLGDPHALRPCNPSINSSRGNKPFGNVSSTGGFGSQGTFYFPGDTDKGDISRSLFYSATRYASSGLVLVNGVPSGNQMGDLASLMAWHYLDTPGTFERHRNHAIFSQTLNPGYRTNNRNAYVDHPEFAWSVYMDQLNDTTLYFGDLEPADGTSTIDLDLSALVGSTIDPMSFTLNKAGDDGTYYRVDASAGLTSSVSGCYNAFPMNMAGVNQPIDLGFDASITASAGQYLGDLTVDNLDVTTMGGAGNGNNDVNDIIFVEVNVYEPGEGSFDGGSDLNTLNLDLGTINLGTGDASQAYSFFNIAAGGSFGAPIDVELISSTGDTGVLATNFAQVDSLANGSEAMFSASMSDAGTGTFSASYTFRVYNDQSLFPNEASIEDLQLVLSGMVEAGGCSIADLAEPFGTLNFFDVSAFLNLFAANDLAADFTDDGVLNFFDVSAFLNAYGVGCP